MNALQRNDISAGRNLANDKCVNRVMGSASAEGSCAEICAGEWITYLRRKLASECLRLGIKDRDASVLQSGSPRHITQPVPPYCQSLPAVPQLTSVPN